MGMYKRKRVREDKKTGKKKIVESKNWYISYYFEGKQIREADWNPQGHSFKQTYNRLVKEGWAYEYDEQNKYLLNSKGIATGKNWVS